MFVVTSSHTKLYTVRSRKTVWRHQLALVATLEMKTK